MERDWIRGKVMDKKPLIGLSICAVVLLVMASLTNVVGYQSVKSTTVHDSPLFQTRTQRATNQQQNILTSQYLGMGKGNLLQFPFGDNNNAFLKRAIEIISNMNDKEFSQFIAFCIQRAKQDKTLRDTNPDEISQAFHQLRIKPETIKNTFIYGNMTAQTSLPEPTCFGSTLCAWFPGCILKRILLDIFSLIELLLYVLTVQPPFPDCDLN
jgi:hypothetical protein